MAPPWGRPRGVRNSAAIWADWQSADDPDRANAFAQEFVTALPTDYVAWFEAGLLSKALGRWHESAARNERAVALFTTADGEAFDGANPAAWNLGIAATALGDWRVARRAWNAYGIPGFDVESAEPIDGNYGTAPVRLNPDRPSLTHQVMYSAGQTEVVWCWRRSPAHAVISSVPLPESGHRFRDVVLHDGQPNGTRRNGERDFSVFDELDRIHDSEMPTWQAILSGLHDGDLDRLADSVVLADLGIDDWSTIPILCSSCSHGSPNLAHDHGQLTSGQTKIGLAGDEDDLRAVVAGWQTEHPHAEVLDLTLLW